MKQMKLQITKEGKRRVASEEFAKMLVHVMADAGRTAQDEELATSMVAAWVAINLLVDADNFVELPSGADAEAQAMTDFMNENAAFIRKTLDDVVASPAFVAHACEVAGFSAAMA